MLEIIAVLSIVGAIILLYSLSAIDLKYFLLPNEMVFGFLALGLVFHLSTVFAYLEIREMLIGGLIGSSILYAIRTAANLFYKEDALGLGDVKLLGAAGIWLGPYYILIALTVGAFAGIVHGLGFAAYKKTTSGETVQLSMLSIPAGPGFAVGIVLTAIYEFRNFPQLVLNAF